MSFFMIFYQNRTEGVVKEAFAASANGQGAQNEKISILNKDFLDYKLYISDWRMYQFYNLGDNT